MKKIDNFIKKYSTVILLLILVLVIAIILVLLGMFLPKTTGDVYGNRLEGIEKVPVTGNIKSSITDAITATEKANSSSVTLNGKIIKVTIKVKDEVKMEDAKKIYDLFKDKFTKEILAYYDVEVIIINKDYSTFGYLKAGRTDLKWTNNK